MAYGIIPTVYSWVVFHPLYNRTSQGFDHCHMKPVIPGIYPTFTTFIYPVLEVYIDQPH